MTIELIRELLQNNNVRWTTHCVEQMGERDISIANVTYCSWFGQGSIVHYHFIHTERYKVRR